MIAHAADAKRVGRPDFGAPQSSGQASFPIACPMLHLGCHSRSARRAVSSSSATSFDCRHAEPSLPCVGSFAAAAATATFRASSKTATTPKVHGGRPTTADEFRGRAELAAGGSPVRSPPSRLRAMPRSRLELTPTTAFAAFVDRTREWRRPGRRCAREQSARPRRRESVKGIRLRVVSRARPLAHCFALGLRKFEHVSLAYRRRVSNVKLCGA